MSENVSPAPDPLLADVHRALAGLKAAEEQACGGYVTARKAQIALAPRLASLHRLVTEQPRRTDYRVALSQAASRYRAAKQRTDLAYQRWQAATRGYDAVWQDTQGRAPRPAPFTAPLAGAGDTDGEVA